MSVNLSGFCEVQQMAWENYIKQVSNLKCKKCSNTGLKMISKWKCKCPTCGQLHTVKKPKNFPKNMNNTRNWGAACDECGGTMRFHKGGIFGAYVCSRCNNIMEV